MRRCLIIGASPDWDYERLQVDLQPDDLLICADGGYRHAKALGLSPEWLVGDFDSLPESGIAPNIIRVKPEKDDTDANLAVLKGRELGYTSFVMYGGLGGRMDHTFSNIQMMAGLARDGIDFRLVDEQSELRVLTPGTYTVQKGSYHYLSLFSLNETCEGVILKGMKYPLDGYTLVNTFPLGCSNEILEEEGSISFASGLLLMIRSNDRRR